jgi:CubicO group peptidase (beta-lactamase class C family)
MRSHLALALLLTASPAAARADGLDQVFAGLGPTTPGCVVGLERAGEPATVRAYGSADLEHAVPNDADTIFEAGSVSKQFTAAALLLLVQDGRLSLDDDIRRYLPELPDYGAPITVAELLSHTSGLRDWGEVEDVAGWPRGERVYSLKDALAVAARQTALNYRPGAHWSYTNTGYNLAAIIVARVSGQSLAAFSQARIFAPLGMGHTRWRDDFRRIVPGRAVAYSSGGHGFAQDMPFEDVYGNAGLLTTVGDLMTWNRALDQARLGGFVTSQLQARGVLAGMREIDYAKGLTVQRYGGAREIAHSGATAGYRAWLGRYPDQRLSVALLCNDGDLNPTNVAHRVADLYLPAVRPTAALSADERARLASHAGWYADDRSGAPLHLLAAGQGLRSEDGREVTPAAGGGYLLGARRLVFRPDGGLDIDQAGEAVSYRRVEPFRPDPAMLAAMAGRFRSEEADATYRLGVEADGLHLRIEQRPDRDFRLEPAYAGAFTYADNVLRLVRDADGAVTALRISSPRMWELRMQRMEAADDRH